MFSLNFFAGFFIVSGFFIFIIRMISNFTKRSIPILEIKIEDCLSDGAFKWIDGLSSLYLENFFNWLIAAPLYCHCFILGIFFFFLSSLKKE